jgi:hypothetical protein
MPARQIPIAIGIVLLVLTGVALLFGGGKNYRWWEHYRPGSKDPYGTYIMHHLLEGYFPGQSLEILEDNFSGKLSEHEGVYLFIGSYLYLDSTDFAALLHFVARGNQAFIASAMMPPILLDSIGKGECVYLSVPEDAPDFELQPEDMEPAYFDSTGEFQPEDTADILADSLYEYVEEDTGEVFTGACEEYLRADTTGTFTDAETEYQIRDSAAVLNFVHPALRDSAGYSLEFQMWNEPVTYSWEYLPPPYFCEEQTVFTQLGTLDTGQVNFVKARYGEGYFYLHTTPLAFTNLFMLEKRGLEYAGKAFSHLSPGDMLWDGSTHTGNRRPTGPEWGKGPLQYMLTQPPLAWAWYILLGMTLLYLVVGAKRRQRIIPVLPQNTNSSLEFIGLMGRLHFLQRNHKQLALQKMKLFLAFVRERYHLSTRDLNEEFLERLAAKSEVEKATLQKILLLHDNISRSGFVSENTLLDFHRLLEGFYKRCK